VGELNHVVEFPGEGGQLQEVRHPPPIDLAVLGQPERVFEECLEPGGRPDLDPDERFLEASVIAARRRGRSGQYLGLGQPGPNLP
jgi:hypothetical protein